MRHAHRTLDFSAYAAAFRSGVSPSEVAQATLAAIRRSDDADPPLRAVITTTDRLAAERAEASSERWRERRPLSELDGVPFVVKDNMDVVGYPTTNGTRIEFPVSGQDALVVARLLRAGAVLVGKANLHEIGAGTTGINPSQGTARNPWNVERWCGGSSSGSACAVAAGLVPLGVGTDAGGSVRAPAAFVGAVGLKPTFGRIARRGLNVVADTLDHVGPIVHSIDDALTALCAMGGVEDSDIETWDQPPLPPLDRCREQVRSSLAGLRIGVARHMFDHPRVDSAVAARVEVAVRALAEAGAQLVTIEIPPVEDCLDIGLVLLAVEGVSGMEEVLHQNEDKLGADLQVLLRIGDHVRARDYLHVQRARRGVIAGWTELFSSVDLVALPGPGMPAGVIRRDALRTGELDEVTSARAISCTFPSNITGFPAVTVPCGTVDGLPVSAQIVGAPWEELLCLRAARAIEEARLFRRARPERYFGDQIIAA